MKVLLTVFFDCNVVMHHEFLPQDRTINKEYNLEVMCSSWILHNDNALAHISMLVPEFLVKNKIVIMPQP